MCEIMIKVSNLEKSFGSRRVVNNFFSGATIPAEVFPKGMRVFADILPLGVGINVLKSISVGEYSKVGILLVILATIFVICTIVAVKAFRWE